MKVFISADVEGSAGVSHWDEASVRGTRYSEARELMTNEVSAACKGAFEAGATQIVIKDAHSNGRNIQPEKLPQGNIKLVRGWSGHPFLMMQELDESFDAAILTGYHCSMASEGNPLGHSFILEIDSIKINGNLASEFSVNALTASLVRVPVVFISGDQAICKEAKAFNESISVEAVTEGIGASAICLTPQQSCTNILNGVTKALKSDFSSCNTELPNHFEVEIKYSNPVDAYRASFYPGVNKIGSQTIGFNSKDYFEVLRMLRFVK